MTNLEMLEMQRSPSARPTPPMDCIGLIQFSQPAWEGGDQSGVDFPVLLGQLGLVPIDIRMDIRTKVVSAIYRWYAFPPHDTLGEATEYRVTVGHVARYEDGLNRPEVMRLIFQPVNNAAIRAQIVAIKTDHCWIINPTAQDLANEPEITDAPVTGGTRHEQKTRRIVIRS